MDLLVVLGEDFGELRGTPEGSALEVALEEGLVEISLHDLINEGLELEIGVAHSVHGDVLGEGADEEEGNFTLFPEVFGVFRAVGEFEDVDFFNGFGMGGFISGRNFS